MTAPSGSRLRHELESVGLATLDLCLAFVGVALVIGPGVVVLQDVLETPLSRGTLRWLVGGISFAGSYPFVTGRWSLGALGESAFRLYASVFVLAVVASVPAVVVGGLPSDSNLASAAQVAVVLGGYVVAFHWHPWTVTDDG